MGFEPQTAGQPLVNLHKRTTKVNLVIVASVLAFLVIGIIYAVQVSRHADKGESHGPPTAPRK